MQKASFALFDFDGTLSKGDSILPFLLYCVRKGLAPKRQLWYALRGFVRQRRHPELVSAAKSEALSFLKGHTAAELDDFSRNFYRDVLEKRLYRQGIAEMQSVHDAGCRVLLVSASPEVYLRVLPEFLPIDDVIATPCGAGENGVYSGLVGENCKGVDKPLRIAAYLAAKHLTLDYETSSAYGDSHSDLPMLTLTAQPVLVNPKQKLRLALPTAKTVHWR